MREQDKLFGQREICEKDRELSLTPSASGDYQAWLCWKCLGEGRGQRRADGDTDDPGTILVLHPPCGPGMAPLLPVIADECDSLLQPQAVMVPARGS